MRLVLDTNVWLDWLVFDDPAVIPLRAARHSDSVEIVIDAPCREELVRVLAYPKFGLDEHNRAKLLTRADQLSTILHALKYPPADRLPACPDPDDVKFLSLASASNADWLITKDNALLENTRKKNPVPTSYRIGTPVHWAGVS